MAERSYAPKHPLSSQLARLKDNEEQELKFIRGNESVKAIISLKIHLANGARGTISSWDVLLID